MNTETPLDQIQDSEVSAKELDEVLDANKDLYDKLNQIPEIEAIEAISLEEEITTEREDTTNPFSELIDKINSFYRENELVRYASWALLLILLSTSALTYLEHEMFKDSVKSHTDEIEGTFIFGENEPNVLDTFFHTFWWSGDDTLDENKFDGHLVIAGWNKTVPSILNLIDSNKDSNSVVILVNETDKDIIQRSIAGYERLDITHIPENFTNESVLRKAFLDKAGAFMILPDSSGLLPHEEPDEDKTVLTCLTAKSISEACNVIAHVLDVENVSHLQRANANEIVIPDEHVPHLLAKHVTDPGVPQFFDDLILQEEDDKGLQEVKIPKTLNGQTHNKISAFFKFKYGWLLVGYAIRKAGFSLDEQMGESGSPLIRNMIKEQLDGAGINLTSDEHVIVEINPADDYKIDEKHSALVLR